MTDQGAIPPGFFIVACLIFLSTLIIHNHKSWVMPPKRQEKTKISQKAPG